MTEVLTSAQMRAIEQAAIDSGTVTGLELMERAGAGVVRAILEEWPDLATGTPRAVVLCGPGNNGGDGFVVARLLKGRGWEVHTMLYGAPEKLPPDARVNYERWCVFDQPHFTMFSGQDQSAATEWLGEALGAQAHFAPANVPMGEQAPHLVDFVGNVVVVDALFGIGLSRPAAETGWLTRTVRDVLGDDRYEAAYYSVAVDIPSGLCADSGRVLRVPEWTDWPKVIPAGLVVTFHRAKAGHYLGEANRYCGRIVAADIGLEPWHGAGK